VIVLVEGDGDKRALPYLLRREGISAPVRIVDMKGKSNIIRTPRGFEDTVRRTGDGSRAAVILIDGDTTYAPYSSMAAERQGLHERAQVLGAELGIVVAVFWATVEFESWLIGGIVPGASYCSLQRVRTIPPNTETAPPDPKEWLNGCLRGGYEPRTAECLAQKIDLPAARRCNQSLDAFLHSMAELASRRVP
jgi:hypothetical protein